MELNKWETVTVELYGDILRTFADDVEFDIKNVTADAITEKSVIAIASPADYRTTKLTATSSATVDVAKLSATSPVSNIIVKWSDATEIAKYDLKFAKDDVQLNSLVLETTVWAYDLAGEFELWLKVWNNTWVQLWTTQSVLFDWTSKYYVYFDNINSQITKWTTANLIVKFNTEANIDTFAKTNKVVKVTPVKNIAGTTAQTIFVSLANSVDITNDVFTAGLNTVSKDMYVRNTNLKVEVVSADESSLKLKLTTEWWADAAIATLPIEFTNAWITKIAFEKIEVAGVVKTTDVAANTDIKAWKVFQFTTPVEIDGNWTIVELFYTTTVDSNANTISSKVRVSDTAEDFTAVAVAWTRWLEWFDGSETTPDLSDPDWFAWYKVVGLPTTWATIK